MSASKNQPAEASKDTKDSKIGQPGLRIRTRLPPRKRLSDRKVPEDTENLSAKEVPEQTDNNTRSMTFTDTKVKVEEASSNPPGEGLCKEANSNNLSKTLSRDKLPEEANFAIPSKNLTTTTGVQDKEESSCYVIKRLSEEGNKIILCKRLPLENSSNTPIKESCIGATDNNPRKNLAFTGVKGEVEKSNSGTRPCEDAGNDILSYRQLYETNSNTSSKGVPEEATNNNPSKNLTTSAMKCEEANDNSVGSSLFEEATNNIATEELSAEARNNASSRRPAVPANDKTSNKKLRTSAVHATGTSQNTSGLKLFTSVGHTVEQSTSAVNLEAIKEYTEFEEKVRRTVYLDNLSHLATEAVINMALNQFGCVKKVNFLVNYTVPYDIPQSALVEMETEKDAESVVNMMHEFPFMMCGMPRPVRGKRATPEMFNDRPQRPGSKLEFRWVGPRDPDFENVRKFKLMSKRHEVENLALIKHELEGEELLARQQQDNLNCSYRKLETLDTVILNGCVNRLTRIYNFSLDDVF